MSIVDIKDNIFENIPKKKQMKFFNNYLKKYIRGKDYYVDGEKIISNNVTIGKLRYGKNNFNRNIDKKIRIELKANIIANIDKIISESKIYQKDRKDTKNHTFADTFDRRKCIIKYKGQKYEIMFEIGKKMKTNTLYGIESIDKTNKKDLISQI